MQKDTLAPEEVEKQGWRGRSCPLCAAAPEIRVDKLDAERLSELYWRRWNTKIGRLFPGGLVDAEIMECGVCGLQFHRPLIAGDGEFYAELSKHDCYYPDVRWEFGIVASMVPNAGHVLDIGAGDGRFLRTLGPGIHIGVELNQDAAAAGRARGLDIRNISLETLGEEGFDVVSLFQVMEHLDDPIGLLKSAFGKVRPGGILAISVPDNGGFVGKLTFEPLNAIPHHPLRWNQQSLEFAAKLIGGTNVRLMREPLQAEHFFQYRKVQLLRGLPAVFHRRMPGAWAFRWVDRLVNLVCRTSLLFSAVSRNPEKGHTILIVVERPGSVEATR